MSARTIAQDEWREYRALKKQEVGERQEERKRREAVIAQGRIAQRAHRDWRDYAQRIVNNTFQVPGHIEIAAFNPTPELIQKLHREARESVHNGTHTQRKITPLKAA